MNNKEEIFEKFKRDKFIDFIKGFNLNSVVLFGSILTEEFNDYSDIDIAIIGNEKIDIDNILEIELFLETYLEREIDVVDLNDKNLDIFIKSNILNNYKTIFTRDNNFELEKFYNKVDREYNENKNFYYFRKVDVLS